MSLDFGVGSTTNIQHDYQKLIEAILRGILETKERLEEQKKDEADKFPEPIKEREENLAKSGLDQKVQIAMTDSAGEERLVYGEDDFGNFVCDIDAVSLLKFIEASGHEVGQAVDGLPEMTVKVDGEIFFQSDSASTILVNQKAELMQSLSSGGQSQGDRSKVDMSQEDHQEADSRTDEDFFGAQVQVPESVEAIQPPAGWEDLRMDMITAAVMSQMSQKQNQVQDEETAQHGRVDGYNFASRQPSQEGTRSLEDEVVDTYNDFFANYDLPSPDPAASREETLAVPTSPSSSVSKDPFVAMEEALGNIPDSPARQVLLETAAQIREQSESQTLDPVMEDVLTRRMQVVNDTNWFNRATSALEKMVESVRDRFAQYQSASTLNDFAKSQGLKPGETYQGTEYDLSREGKTYTLCDKEGNELMRFESGMLGVRVDNKLPVLEEFRFQQISQLAKELEQSHQPSGAFVSEAAWEGKYLSRIENVTTRLSKIAASEPSGKKSTQGKNFDWTAAKDGSVMIWEKKEGQKNLILAYGKGHLRSEISDETLSKFEQMLDSYEDSRTQNNQRSATGSISGNQGKRRESGIGSRESGIENY